MKDDFVEELQIMWDRFKRKQNLHQRAFRMFKDRDFYFFVIPLMVIQLLNTILPQIAQVFPENGMANKILSVMVSSLAAVSAVWVGFQAKLRHADLSGGHKNAASIYQHLAVLAMVEIQKAKMMKDYDKENFFTFHDMAHNLEGKAKDDDYLVPLKIKREKELDDIRKICKQDRKVSHEENVRAIKIQLERDNYPDLLKPILSWKKMQ